MIFKSTVHLEVYIHKCCFKVRMDIYYHVLEAVYMMKKDT